MKILNYGSINIDHVYRVRNFVQPGETLGSLEYERFAGGKGCNQSIALARAGASVAHAGKVGLDGVWLREKLDSEGIDVEHLEVCDGASGHAIIQVDDNGENCIILYGGANQELKEEVLSRVFSQFTSDDFLLMQNEINLISEIIRRGSETGMKVVFNPAPMHESINDYPLDLVDILILNEIEGKTLSGELGTDEILPRLCKMYPNAMIVLTLGARGVFCAVDGDRIFVPAEQVSPVDTTAAGDTFIGFFMAELSRNSQNVEFALRLASKAASICVTRSGAADSIPFLNEI